LPQLIVCLIIAAAGFALGRRVERNQTNAALADPIETTQPDLIFPAATLAVWSVAILMALGLLASDRAGGANTFLVAWLAAAGAGWVLAARRLWQQLT